MKDTASDKSGAKHKPLEQPAKRTAFAFGGVGGFNAHNAGVLQALLDYELDHEIDHKIEPGVITCTSGAMWWVYQYLLVRNHSLANPSRAKGKLREQLKEQAEASSGLSALSVATCGDPGIFRPATPEYFLRWLQPWPEKAMNFLASTPPWSAEYWQQPFMVEFFNRLLPAQDFVPTRPTHDFTAIADTLNAETAPPIMFNVYDVQNGREIVYGNKKALALLNIDGRIYRNQQTQERQAEPYPADVPQRVYGEITKEAVAQALWLVWYGLDANHTEIDGAYRRQIILSELTMCDKVYVVKPQPGRFSNGNTPTNYFGVQDFQTEMWLNSSYDSEVADLSHHAVRHDYKRAKGRSDVPKHEPRTIDIVPISRPHPLGYFNYFIEQLSNFDDAYAKASGDFDGNAPLPSVKIYEAIP